MPSLTAKIDDGIDGLGIDRMQRYFLMAVIPVADYADAVIADLGQLSGVITDIDCLILNTAAAPAILSAMICWRP